MTRRERNTLAVLALALALLAARIVTAQSLGGDPLDGSPAVNRVCLGTQCGSIPTAPTDDATALVLAQAFVAEAGFDAADDHAAIAHVLDRNARRLGVPLLGYAIRYVSLLRVNADGRHVVQSERAVWVRTLSLDARKPDGWPRNLAWSAHVDRWLATVERARAFLRGELADPCAGERVRHWGGKMDRKRARRAGWVLARCSARLRNDAWVAR